MLKIALFQPLVPKYRSQVFELLASYENVSLTVFAGGDMHSLKADTVVPKHYKLINTPVKKIKFAFSLKWQSRVFSTINNDSYNLVILSWDIHYLNLPFAIIYARILKKPIILWGHGYSKSPKNITNFIRNVYGRFSDGVLVYDKTTAKNLVEKYNYDESRIFVAQNAIDLTNQRHAYQHYSKNIESLKQFRRENGLLDNSAIIFVSRLEPDNEAYLLIDGMKKLLVSHSTYKLIIIGDGSDKKNLEEYANTLEITDNIIFTGAIYDENKIAPWMLSAKLFCYPRNIGLSILHAFSYGLPVVTGDDIGSHNPEIEALEPGLNGILFKDRNTDDMVSKWIQIIDNPELQSQMKMEALKQTDSKYTISEMVKGFLDLVSVVK